jgi:hypothetical protein
MWSAFRETVGEVEVGADLLDGHGAVLDEIVGADEPFLLGRIPNEYDGPLGSREHQGLGDLEHPDGAGDIVVRAGEDPAFADRIMIVVGADGQILRPQHRIRSFEKAHDVEGPIRPGGGADLDLERPPGSFRSHGFPGAGCDIPAALRAPSQDRGGRGVTSTWRKSRQAAAGAAQGGCQPHSRDDAGI